MHAGLGGCKNGVLLRIGRDHKHPDFGANVQNNMDFNFAFCLSMDKSLMRYSHKIRKRNVMESIFKLGIKDFPACIEYYRQD